LTLRWQATIIARRMRRGLPERISPSRQATEGGTVQGVVALAQLPRLQAALERIGGGRGEIEVELRLWRDAQQRLVLSGTVSGRLTLQCQRCLGPMDWDASLELELLVLPGEAGADVLDAGAEFVMAPEDSLSPRQVVEDELILALPLIPRHDNDEDCQAPAHEPVPAEAPDKGKPNPFAVLKRLKR
jgi:uncharacterized protein